MKVSIIEEIVLCENCQLFTVGLCSIIHKATHLGKHVSMVFASMFSLSLASMLMLCFPLPGALLSYFRGLIGSREMRILILGLDGAGKTTILYRLQVGEVVTTIPTIGFNVEQVTYKNLRFQVWDLGGQTSIR